MARNANALVIIDPAAFTRLGAELRLFEPKLLTGMRRRFKELAQVGVEAVRADVLGPSPDGDTDVDVRQMIADSVRTTVSFRGKGAGVRISASASKLPTNKKPMLAAYNSGKWKHQGYWQTGNPYFGAAIKPVMDDHLLDQMRAAIDEACFAIGARGR